MEVLVQTIPFTRAFARVVVLGFTMATKMSSHKQRKSENNLTARSHITDVVSDVGDRSP
jgi:hypothetical protein